MVTFREIIKNDLEAREAAWLVQRYSWGLDYPVSALDEFKQADLIIGAFSNGKLIGCACVNKVASPDAVDNGEFWFADAIVIEEYRKQGIFKAMNEKCMEFLRQNAKLAFACTDNPVVEKFLINNGWIFHRITKDESGSSCKVFKIKRLYVF